MKKSNINFTDDITEDDEKPFKKDPEMTQINRKILKSKYERKYKKKIRDEI